MKSTTTILAALAVSVTAAIAGPEPAPVSTGKNPPPPPPPADPCAGPISYNNIELLYQYTDWDGNNADAGNGGILRFEYSPTPYFYITGGVEYNDSGYDTDLLVNPQGVPLGITHADFEQWDLTLGIGGHFPITHHIDIAADGGVLWSQRSVDFHVPGPSNNFSETDDDTGWYVRPQIRAKWGCFTAHLGAEYRDVRNDNSWIYFVNVYYQVNPAWDVTVGYRHTDDFDAVTGGIRWRY
jgi:hypothetical protein